MIYILPEEYYTAINDKMPNGINFGFEDTGRFYLDDAILPFLNFDYNITLKEAIGKDYNELINELEPLNNYMCKIYNYIEDYMLSDIDKTIPPLGINYKTGLTIRLYSKRLMVKGEVTRVDYYSDSELTDLVLTVLIEYVRDDLGFAISRKTTRQWVMNNGEYNPITKITEKKYTINPEDQIKEGIRRRQNIIDGLQPKVLSLLFELLIPEGKTTEEILFLGRDFLDRYEPEFDRFVKSSSTIVDPNDPNFGKKEVAVIFENATDTWLDETPASLNGVSVRAYMIDEVSI